MKFELCLCILVLAINCEVQTVQELDIVAYMGTWYEVVSSPLVHLTFERNNFCTQATYTLREDGKIDVNNLGRKNSKTAPLTGLPGIAYQTDPENYPGKLKVEFNNGHAGDYWIVELGPIVNGKYDYVIVSEPRKQFMWVLSRDPVTYYEKYGVQNKQRLTKELGYTGLLNKYVDRDNTGCPSTQ